MYWDEEKMMDKSVNSAGDLVQVSGLTTVQQIMSAVRTNAALIVAKYDADMAMTAADFSCASSQIRKLTNRSAKLVAQLPANLGIEALCELASDLDVSGIEIDETVGASLTDQDYIQLRQAMPAEKSLAIRLNLDAVAYSEHASMMLAQNSQMADLVVVDVQKSSYFAAVENLGKVEERLREVSQTLPQHAKLILDGLTADNVFEQICRVNPQGVGLTLAPAERTALQSSELKEIRGFCNRAKMAEQHVCDTNITDVRRPQARVLRFKQRNVAAITL